ncbi:MAG: hypothetical protein KZQ82_17380, partial [Candidatus Thiodiazotropha sp. (ex Lucinoma annulata)]|nr:hypothetical protein [Candidatus Thiodiazotropha sp. (ex Lucinoma annulata)]
GPGDLSYNEYNPLFTRNGLAFQLDASIAEENTWSNDAIIAGLYDRVAFSLGQYHTETDGFRTNTDYEQDIYNVFAQFSLSEYTSLQIEISQDEVTKGDVSQRLLPSLLVDENLRVETDTKNSRLGFNHTFSPKLRVLASTINRDKEISASTLNPSFNLLREVDIDISIHDLQIQYISDKHSFIGGLNYNQDDFKTTSTFNFSPAPCLLPFPDCTQRNEFVEKQSRLYGYYFYQPSERLNLTSALSVVRDTSDIFSNKETHVLPKLGAQLSLNNKTTLRIAALRTNSTAIESSLYRTLEPTQIVGFNQIYDELRQTDAWNYGVGINHKFLPSLTAGLEGVYREGETPFDLLDTRTFVSSKKNVEFTETNIAGWVNWSPYKHWSISLEYYFNEFNKAKNFNTTEFSGLSADGVLELETHSLPFAINYYHPLGFIFGFTTTYFDQKGIFQGNQIFDIPREAEDRFWLSDLAISYRLPRKHGLISLGVKNVFDKDFDFEDRNSYDSLSVEASASPSALSPERIIFGQLSLTFR